MRKPVRREALLRRLGVAAVGAVLLAGAGPAAGAATILPPHRVQIHPKAPGNGPRSNAAPAQPRVPLPPALGPHPTSAQAGPPHHTPVLQGVIAATRPPHAAAGRLGGPSLLAAVLAHLRSLSAGRPARGARGPVLSGLPIRGAVAHRHGQAASAMQGTLDARLLRVHDARAAADPTSSAFPYVAAGNVDPSLWTSLPPMITSRAGSAAAAAPCVSGERGGTCVYVVGGIGSNGVLASMEMYSPRRNNWTALAPMITPRWLLAAAAAPCIAPLAGTCVYVVGGVDSNDTAVASTEMYSPRTNSWAALPPMTTARAVHAAAAAPCTPPLAGTCIYALGGTSAIQVLSTVEMYSPRTNTWTLVAPMTTPRFGLAGTAASCPAGQHGTCLYAVGGVVPATQGFDALPTAEAYSPGSNTWSTLAPMPGPRALLGAAAARCPGGQRGTCVYAIGGSDSYYSQFAVVESTAFVYGPVTNTWTALPSMSAARVVVAAAGARCPAGVRGTCAYALGGFDGIGTTLGSTEALIST